MKRSYKDHFSHVKAKEIIKNSSGSHFDPRLVEVFFSEENAFKKFTPNWPTNDRLWKEY